jgi:hypothetical protein
MRLRCIKPFGNSVPGDVLENVPDGAAFDRTYFETADDPAGATAPAPAATPAPDPLSDAAHALGQLADHARESDG